jgi:hypothetical protein
MIEAKGAVVLIDKMPHANALPEKNCSDAA